MNYLDEEHKIKGDCLAVGMIAMKFFYMQKDFYAGQFTKRAIPKSFNLTPKIANYFISWLNKNSSIYQSVLVRDFEKVFNETKISLPTKNKQIDFNFMENFIAELEAYLNVTGLKDYVLTNEEQKALQAFLNTNLHKKTHDEKINNDKHPEITWAEFRLGELFEVNSSRKIYHANQTDKIFDEQVKSSFPYVVRTTKNNGIKGYIIDDEKYTNDEKTLSFAQDTFSVFYQKEKYFTGNKVKILKAKFENKSEKSMHYLAASFQKSLKDFTWGIGSTVDTINETPISLPIKNNQIDFNFMENFISAVQKLVIRGVVEYADKKLAASKIVAQRS